MKTTHNKQHHDFYRPLGIQRIEKSRRLRWAGHFARSGETKNVYRILVAKPVQNVHLEDLEVHGRKILR
jgi:hypothetical protein